MAVIELRQLQLLPFFLFQKNDDCATARYLTLVTQQPFGVMEFIQMTEKLKNFPGKFHTLSVALC